MALIGEELDEKDEVCGAGKQLLLFAQSFASHHLDVMTSGLCSRQDRSYPSMDAYKRRCRAYQLYRPKAREDTRRC